MNQRTSKLRYANKSFSKSFKRRISNTIENALQTKDETDITNHTIKDISKLNVKRKQIIHATRSVKYSVQNFLDKRQIKKNKDELYQRLKFDDNLKDVKETISSNKIKLRDKSVLALGVSNAIRHTKSSILSAYMSKLETNDKTDTADRLLKDVNATKNLYSDVRQGFNTLKVKKALKGKNERFLKTKSRLNSTKKSVLKNKKLNNKDIQKNSQKRSMQKTLQKKLNF